MPVSWCGPRRPRAGFGFGWQLPTTVHQSPMRAGGTNPLVSHHGPARGLTAGPAAGQLDEGGPRPGEPEDPFDARWRRPDGWMPARDGQRPRPCGGAGLELDLVETGRRTATVSIFDKGHRPPANLH